MNILLVIVGIYAAITGGLFLFQRNLIYHPSTDVPVRSEAGVPDMRTVTLTTKDGLSLLAWYKKASSGRPTVVLFHGNAGHIGYRGFKARAFIDKGYGVLLLEYRGYGGNPGKPTEAGLYADGQAAIEYLNAEGVQNGQMILYGESLGSGVAVYVAAAQASQNHFAGLILEAPYTSISAVAAHHYPFVPARWLIKDRFDAVGKIGQTKSRVFIVHGVDDRVIPIEFGRALFAAAPEPKDSRWIPEAGHNDLFQAGGGIEILSFLDRHFSPGTLRFSP